MSEDSYPYPVPDRVPDEAVERAASAIERELRRWGYDDTSKASALLPSNSILELCAARALEASGAFSGAPPAESQREYERLREDIKRRQEAIDDLWKEAREGAPPALTAGEARLLWGGRSLARQTGALAEYDAAHAKLRALAEFRPAAACPHPRTCWAEGVCLSVEGGGPLCSDVRGTSEPG